MPDPSTPPSPPLQREQGRGLLREISRALVAAKKEYFGKGPEHARAYMVEDLLFVVMRGGITPAERTMLEAGQKDAVRDFRQRFQNEMTGHRAHLASHWPASDHYHVRVCSTPTRDRMFVFGGPGQGGSRGDSADLLDPGDDGGAVS